MEAVVGSLATGILATADKLINLIEELRQMQFLTKKILSDHQILVAAVLEFDADIASENDRFCSPVDKAQFDALFTERYGANGERLFWRATNSKCTPLHQVEMLSNSLDRIVNAQRRDPKRDWVSNAMNPAATLLEDHGWRISQFEPRSGLLCEYSTSPFESNWAVQAIYDRERLDPNNNKPGEPHISCLLAHDVPMTGKYKDCVPRGELLSILRLMVERALDTTWQDCAVLPVFVYSFSADYVRITQAHFDGKRLQLRRTEPVSIVGSNWQETVKMLLRWILAQPRLPAQQKALVVPRIRTSKSNASLDSRADSFVH
ncbi:Hypothetical protein R9X50_00389500 [Acrodontium crateriforme]|uniref:Uncharacterized protein n=1 Tax=Acrodontium crateriforme TaxID=150365 RepID=A0AAQ3M4B0_9PEZI|nr:Hypothetical protein R9X50_00389500 [Acrodontium crateriforme]